MIWQSASEFWAMGGYGVYVWGSMGVSAALLALEVLLARAGRQQALSEVCDALQAAEESAAELAQKSAQGSPQGSGHATGQFQAARGHS